MYIQWFILFVLVVCTVGNIFYCMLLEDKIKELQKQLDDTLERFLNNRHDLTLLSEDLKRRVENLEKVDPELKKKRTMWDTFPRDKNNKPIIH